ncbi:ArsR/SmtB family transcription factor [Halobacillus seohaensis]|uniref:ArsR/SmtB family transcription factor n=1 Tax=Halobacillus seohaensis TaxID=447421 RepID=A0ABW2EUR8_9BACI
MDKRTFKNSIYNEFTRIGKVLSSPKRLELLDLLSQSPKSVETLSNETKMSTANTSKHLQALLDGRLVDYRKEKNFVIYYLANQKVIDLLFSIKGIAEEQIAEVNLLREEFIGRNNELDTIKLEDWMNRKENGNHILIDVRPQSEYMNGHLDGALSIPMDEINDYLKNLPKDKEVIAYCRGPYCVYATEAVELLQSEGYQAARLDAGIHEWNQYQDQYSH